jgi:hypothetical protein
MKIPSTEVEILVPQPRLDPEEIDQDAQRLTEIPRRD